MWKRRIGDKFRNSRKRVDRRHPAVMKRFSTILTSGPAKKKMKNAWGLVNFLPDRNEEDDDASIKSFTDFLKVRHNII